MTATREQLEALAAKWDAEAEEEMEVDGGEWSRGSLAAGILETCARELRDLI